MVVADFGSGSGFWALPLAKYLEEGRVYAVDLMDGPLSALRAKIRSEKAFNVETVKSDVEKNSKLLGDSCDLVLTANILFESKSGKKILEEGKRVLRARGRILVVDWKKDASLGPENRISPDKVKKIAEGLDLKLTKEFNAGNYHYGLIFEKS